MRHIHTDRIMEFSLKTLNSFLFTPGTVTGHSAARFGHPSVKIRLCPSTAQDTGRGARKPESQVALLCIAV